MRLDANLTCPSCSASLKDVVDISYSPARRKLRPSSVARKKTTPYQACVAHHEKSNWSTWEPFTAPSAVACDTVTAEELRSILKGKTLTFLGDSQHCERVEMVVMTLFDGDTALLKLKGDAHKFELPSIRHYRNLTARFEKPNAVRDFLRCKLIL